MTESLTHSDGFSSPFLSMCIPFIQTSRWERWVGKKKKNPWKLFPGILPRNEWWIDPRNSFKSHFLCSCEVMRFLCATLWALEWMKMAQNTLKVYHWFKVIDGWSCLIVLYCWTIHHSKQTLYSIVQYMVTCDWRGEFIYLFFPESCWWWDEGKEDMPLPVTKLQSSCLLGRKYSDDTCHIFVKFM